mgnify:CR=1 FL=1
MHLIVERRMGRRKAAMNRSQETCLFLRTPHNLRAMGRCLACISLLRDTPATVIIRNSSAEQLAEVFYCAGGEGA